MTHLHNQTYKDFCTTVDMDDIDKAEFEALLLELLNNQTDDDMTISHYERDWLGSYILWLRGQIPTEQFDYERRKEA